ncbi:antitoxin Xre/MbcA/ParS toxin-binding domain-containing protein [Aestuariivita sp.]|jgi:putative toxin-antitoxin system antitoxin component (TIGR02293 family)|uniref:antitoxin Xre/MbcA/ParS toxin-binding domain-containing protein n=1 Tax=Aestuariivita sp. TaxID=1872407 RepID=UPI002172743A|nr:antitoxin Xre/MbcA/ParS toxin-binding domain-containing protein [Aestuariivita sp.]MCE8007090.1 DUF2384 domain-containing protein [Aestuariivita sp.]
MALLDFYATPDRLPSSEAQRLGRILGLTAKEPINDIDLAERISVGLRPSSVDTLSSILGRGDVVGCFIPEASLRRARKERKALSKELSERLYEVGRVVDAVSRNFHGDKEAIDRFLKRPHRLLAGKSPLEMAQSSSAGAEAVINLLRRAEASFAV